MKILVLGLDNAGKTTILTAMSNEDISLVTPTQGSNIKILVNGEFKLNLYDSGYYKVTYFIYRRLQERSRVIIIRILMH